VRDVGRGSAGPGAVRHLFLFLSTNGQGESCFEGEQTPICSSFDCAGGFWATCLKPISSFVPPFSSFPQFLLEFPSSFWLSCIRQAVPLSSFSIC